MANICLPPHIHTPKKSNVLYFHDQTPSSVLTSMTFPNASYHHCQHHQLMVGAVSGVRPGCQRQLPTEETTNFWSLNTQNKLCCLCCTRTGEWQSPWQPVAGELEGGDHEPLGIDLTQYNVSIEPWYDRHWYMDWMTSSTFSLCDHIGDYTISKITVRC